MKCCGKEIQKLDMSEVMKLLSVSSTEADKLSILLTLWSNYDSLSAGDKAMLDRIVLSLSIPSKGV